MSNIEEKTSLTGLASFLSQLDNKNNNVEHNQAVTLLSKEGFPTRRSEMWKYTDLRWLNNLSFVAPQIVAEHRVKEWLDTNILSSEILSKLPRLVIVNGYIVTEYSTLLEYEECDFCVVNEKYGSLARPEHDVMTTLNYAMGHKTIEIKVEEQKKAGTILLVNLGYQQDTGCVTFHPRLNIALEPYAQLSIVELNAGYGQYFTNPVCQVSVGSHADFQYNKLVNSSLESYVASNLYVELADHAQYNQFLMSKGAKFSRQEVYLTLNGEWSNASFQAVQTLHDRQHADITTVFSHLVPHCESEQNVKNILSDQSRAVFQGKVYVDQKAQKTNAQQQNRALLLSDQAEIDTKPELEIYADDVKCSHGATVGALDQDQLFFLMARGIPYDQARLILTNAFIAEAIEEVKDPIAQILLREQLGVEIVRDIT